MLFESIAYKATESQWTYVKIAKGETLVGLHGYLYGDILCNVGIITYKIPETVRQKQTTDSQVLESVQRTPTKCTCNIF